MKFNESFRDTVRNSFLYLRSRWRGLIDSDRFGNEEPSVVDMQLTFSDQFSSFDALKWRVGQPWGVFHPDSPNQYYGEDSVSVRLGKLALAQQYRPKTFTTDREYLIPYSVGLVTSYETFGYGFYEFEAILPNGPGLWPAIWLGCYDTWPPEIDIIEAYSDLDSKYGLNLQSNLHFGKTPNKSAAGARNHQVTGHNLPLKLSCWITENFIKIYYNGYLVREVTSEHTLKWFRDKKYMIILNNGVRPGFESCDPEQYSEFLINYVRVWQ